MPSDNTLLSAAQDFAARGWPVFPCSPENKQPLVAARRDGEGKPIRGTGGVSAASCDANQVQAWWTKWPNAMIGLAMGRNGLFALDFDPRIDDETGEVFTLDTLKAELETQMGCALPASLAVVTPSGGVHVYLRQPEGEPIRNRGNLPRHVDVRGEGGYVIAPPSSRADGIGYRWLRGEDQAEAAEAPPVLVEILRTKGKGERKPSGDVKRAAQPDVQGQVDDAVRKYAMAALDGEIRTVQGAPDGTRNNQLNASAYALGQLVGAGALPISLVRAALQDAARAWPDYPKSEGTIESGLTAGIEQPRDLSEIASAAAARGQRRGGRTGAGLSPVQRPEPPPPDSADDFGFSPAPPPDGDGQPASFQMEGPPPSPPAGGRGDDELDRKLAFYPLTDLGNAERFRDRFGGRFLWCPAIGWFAWDGKRWNSHAAEALVQRAVYDTVRAIGDEAELVKASGHRDDGGLDFIVKVARDGTITWYSDKIAQWGRVSEGAGHLACIARLAQPFLEVDVDDFDVDPFAINVLNGTIRVGKGDDGKPRVRFTRHDPADRITKIARVIYDPQAASPDYDAFMERVQPNEATRRFLHAWGGLSLTDDVSDQKLVFGYGTGRNGKSTWVEALAWLAGDYSDTVPINSLMDQGRQRKGGDATPDLAKLTGVRLLRASEPEKGAKLAEALIKLVTGGEPVDVRHLNKDFFKLIIKFKLTISGNYRPKIDGTDEGIWRRMLLVPWQVTIPKEEVDRDLPKKLQAEGAGILNRLLAGLLDWMEHGLKPPEEVDEATSRYRADSDPLGQFLGLCVVEERDQRIGASALHAVFSAWCKSAGEKEWSPKGLSSALLDRGWRKLRSNGMQWKDVKLIKQVSDFVDEHGRPLEDRRPDDGPDDYSGGGTFRPDDVGDEW
ncbi:hypothetical protein BSL82_02370 [Tardibacter chloracetimidivorans]|uniref:SF3 helicase domain-containing protein n=1 Tax=Tardibacter chloracetimidivorans TaxID=1921510 RepID=A0A1L3ZRN4_9SPHN|nr:phage/plasmid primase, P4 family [Tardibacter chloracetimidivorans]API58292.1 hypothetical protein BSL82_02370 [Tardibacter chloracetimidivorans]